MNDKDENIIVHLEALRATLIKCFVSVGIILPFAFITSPKLLNFTVKTLVSGTNITLKYFAPMEVFILQIKLALLMSVIIAFPYIAKKIWDFVLPALYEHERSFIGKMVFISSILFIFGIIFCIFVILPLIIKFGISFGGEYIDPVWGISNLVNLALWLAFTFGLMFQVPVITYLLIKFGLLTYDSISSKRPYVVVSLMIAAALLTPPDIVSQILLFIPTYLLFELGLVFSKFIK